MIGDRLDRVTGARLALLASVSAWATAAVATKFAVADVGPITIAFLRFVIASVVLVPVAISMGGWRLPWLRLALLGAVGITASYALGNSGMALSSASDAAVLTASIPSMTAILAILLIHERVGRARWLGIVISGVGVAAIVLSAAQAASTAAPNPLLGDLLLLGMMFAWSLYTVWARDQNRALSGFVVTAWVGAFGALFLAPLVVIEVTAQPPTFPLDAVLAIVYMGIVVSGAALVGWNYALRYVDATEAGVWSNATPVVGVILSIALLGEQLRPAQVVGGLLVIIGVWVASRLPGHRVTPKTGTEQPAAALTTSDPPEEPVTAGRRGQE